MQVEFKILEDKKIIAIKEEDKAQVLEEIETAIKNCKEYIEKADNLKGAYFWTPASNSNGRRQQEKRYSFKASQKASVFEYEFEISVRVSSRNFYVDKYVAINDNEGTARTVNTFLNDLKKLRLYLTQEDVLIKLSKEAKAFQAAQEGLEDTEELIFSELLNTFDYATLKAYKSLLIQTIIEETTKILLTLNKRAITAKKAADIQNSFEFVGLIASKAKKFTQTKEVA